MTLNKPKNTEFQSKVMFELRSSEVENEGVDGTVEACHHGVPNCQGVGMYMHLELYRDRLTDDYVNVKKFIKLT